MAGDLATTLYEVRRLIGDRRKGDPIVPDPLIEELTQTSIDELSDEMGTGQIKTASWKALVAGTMTYTVTLPSSIPGLLHLQQLILQSTGYPLEKRDLDFILAMRVNNSDAKGQPRYWCVREDNAGVLTLEIYPSPAENDAVDAYWEPVHRRVRAGTNYTTIAFSDIGLSALRLRVAGKVILALAPEALAKLSPPKTAQFGASMLEESRGLAQVEFARMHDGALVDFVQRTR